MVRIRKKTSKRTGTHMREKVKKKVNESHRKAAKHAKKDVTWKSKKPKDIGVPANFPFKDQVLAEAAAEKARLAEQKVLNRQQLNEAATIASKAAFSAAESAAFEDAQMETDSEDEEALQQDASLKLHARSLRKVLELSDVVVMVLDARDPMGTRCRAVERELKSMDGGRKKLVLVLNKIDLAPPKNVQAWLTYLRTLYPTLPFKSSTQEQRMHLSSASTSASTSSAAGSNIKPLLELIKGFRLSTGAASGQKQSLTIGVIGHPNVGKSSLINTLKRSRACSVAPTPGWTKDVQSIALEKGVRVLDCPGVVVDGRSEVDAALGGMIRAEDVTDVRAAVARILQRAKKEGLMLLYKLPYFDGEKEFLIEVARVKGRLRKGGVPDLDGSARSVLRDWTAGRIPYYTVPPTTLPSAAGTTAVADSSAMRTTDDLGASALVSEFAPAFDLAALFGEADADALDAYEGDAKAGVRMIQGALDPLEEGGELGWMGPKGALRTVEDGPSDEEDDDDESEEDDEESMAVESDLVPVAKGKMGKSVVFAAEHLGPTAGKQKKEKPAGKVVQRQKLFIDAGEEEEEPVAVNKDIKKAAKAAKKKAAKEARGLAHGLAGMDVEEEEGDDSFVEPNGEPAVSSIKAKSSKVAKKQVAAQTKKAQAAPITVADEPYDFNEFYGPGAGAGEMDED